MSDMVRKTGTVQFFNRASGNGLVRPDDGSEEFYIQMDCAATAARLDRGRKVAYVIKHPQTPAAWIDEIRPL